MSEYKYDLQHKISVKIPIDKRTPFDPSKFQTFTDSLGEWLVVYNRAIQEIQYYNLEGDAKYPPTKIPREGPDAPKYPEYFFMSQLDSITIFSPKTGSAKLYNRKGVLLDKIEYETNIDKINNPWDYGLSHIFITNNNWAHEFNGKIYCPAIPLGPKSSVDHFTKATVVQSLSWQNKEVKDLYNYPSLYREKNFAHLAIYHFMTKGHDGFFVHSFTGDPYLYKTDYGDINEAKLAKSSTIEAPVALDIPLANSYNLPDIHRQNTSTYRAILYDKHHQVYYRFVIGPQEVEDVLLTQRERSASLFSIIILDKELNKIGEKIMPKDRYNYHFAFVGKKGLYISTSHPRNKNISEDEFEFDVFSPLQYQ